MNHRIDFENMEWVCTGVGARSKTIVNGNQRLRLVEFSEGFVEPDWCRKGHAGYVLDGEFAIDFDGKVERFRKGDIIFIPAGQANQHKAAVGKGEKVTLILFEVSACE